MVYTKTKTLEKHMLQGTAEGGRKPSGGENIP